MMDYSTSLFPDLAFADDQLDSSCWLFKDDQHSQQDFQHVAKDVHSLSSLTAGDVSPPFLSSNDLPEWMEGSNNIDWNQPFSFEDCFPHNLKKHAQDQQLDLQPTINDVPSEIQDIFEDGVVTQDVKIEYPQQQHSPQLLQQAYVNQVLYQEEPDVASPLSCSTADAATLEYITGLPEPVNGGDDVVTYKTAVNTPYIISVPLTDALSEQKKNFNKKINITSIQVLDDHQSSLNQVNKLPIQPVSTIPATHQQKPQQIVINLKMVSLPSKSLVKTGPVEIAKPTLKEILSRDDADDLIRELVSPLSPISSSSSVVDDVAYRYTSYYSPQSDSGVGVEDNSCHGLLLSPSSSDGYSSSDQYPESPAGYASDAQQQGKGTCRYSPYSIEEKRLRKKEQNKRAALRYRQKKKEEEDSAMTILQREKERRNGLKDHFNALKMEVKIMKDLLREFNDKKGQG